jgi:hypothetical protein
MSFEDEKYNNMIWKQHIFIRNFFHNILTVYPFQTIKKLFFMKYINFQAKLLEKPNGTILVITA